jgi:hypothetical protein
MKAKSLPQPGCPLEIRRGAVSVRVYAGKNRVNGKAYPQFTLAYYSGNQRVKRRFSNREEAKREGEIVAVKLANGENEVLKLTSTDRSSYLQAREAVRPLNLSLHTAVNEFVSAIKRLPQGTHLREAVDFFLRRNPASLPQKTTREVVVEFVESKTKAGRAEAHLKDLTGRLRRFADDIQMNIGQVTGGMIERHLTSLNVAARTRKNHLRHIMSLFKFAIRKKYLHKDAIEELEVIEKPEQSLTEIEISRLMNSAKC